MTNLQTKDKKAFGLMIWKEVISFFIILNWDDNHVLSFFIILNWVLSFFIILNWHDNRDSTYRDYAFPDWNW